MTRRAFLVVVLAVVGLTLPVPASAGGGGCTELTRGSGVTVEILHSCITPTLLRVDPGEQVTFVNRDDYRHVIAGAGYAWSSDGYMPSGEAFTATFRGEGVYPFQCYLHPGMAGAVIVGDGTGPGAATGGSVVVEPLVIAEEPLPEVVYLTRPAGIRNVRASSATAWTGGVVVGIAAGAVIALVGSLLLRRRSSAVRG